MKKACARAGELNPACVAIEQLYANAVLQLLYEAAQRRLRDVHALRRLGELPCLGEQDEGAELAKGQIHFISLVNKSIKNNSLLDE